MFSSTITPGRQEGARLLFRSYNANMSQALTQLATRISYSITTIVHVNVLTILDLGAILEG